MITWPWWRGIDRANPENRLPELTLKNRLIHHADTFLRFTPPQTGRKLRAFSSIAETLSGYLFEWQLSAGFCNRHILGKVTRILPMPLSRPR
jgi:hypothetical protein